MARTRKLSDEQRRENRAKTSRRSWKRWYAIPANRTKHLAKKARAYKKKRKEQRKGLTFQDSLE